MKIPTFEASILSDLHGFIDPVSSTWIPVAAEVKPLQGETELYEAKCLGRNVTALVPRESFR